MQSEIILNQIFILSIIVIIGVIATKAGIIRESLKDGIAALVVNITLPFLIFSSFTALDITIELLRNGLLVIIMTYVSLFLLLLSGRATSAALRLERETSSIHVLHTAFGNIVFLGFPLINALFPGGQALFYATLFYLASTSVMWTVGVNILNYSSPPDIRQKIKNLVNPNTIAFIAGIIFMLSGIAIPPVLDIPFTGLGQTTSYLSMIYIGSMLAGTSIHNVFRRREAYVLSVNKMVITPVVLIILFRLLLNAFSVEMDPVAFAVVIIQAGTPCMAIIVVLARQFNADEVHATENVFISTILSLVTLPFLYWLIEAIKF